MNTYIELVGLLHPTIQCDAIGDTYEDIVWKTASIPKAALDAQLSNLNQFRADARAKETFSNAAPMKALIQWIAPLVGKTEEDAFAEIEIIFKAL